MPWLKSPWLNDRGYIIEWSAMTVEEEREILIMLEKVGHQVRAIPDMPWGFCGSRGWTLSTGWRVYVFNDCGDWDYLERLEAPNGCAWEYPLQEERREGCAMSRAVAHWSPSSEAQRKAWGLP